MVGGQALTPRLPQPHEEHCDTLEREPVAFLAIPSIFEKDPRAKSVQHYDHTTAIQINTHTHTTVEAIYSYKIGAELQYKFSAGFSTNLGSLMEKRSVLHQYFRRPSRTPPSST